jgi:hypothetical protein
MGDARVTNVTEENAKRITYSECVSVALVAQPAMRMRLFILSSVAYLGLPYFSTLSHKGTIFLEKKLLHVKRVFNYLYSFV